MGDTPYRIVFAINPLKSGEIDKVLVSEEDVDKIKQLREIAIYPNGNVITRKIGKNSTTPLVYYLTKEYARYIEHKNDNPLDFRRENIIFLRKETPREGVGNWKLGLVTNRRALEEKERAERLFEDAKREENQRFKIYQIYNQNMIRAGELICAARKENHSPNADKDKVIALLMEAVERMGGIKGGDLK